MNNDKILIKSPKPITTLLVDIETAIVNAGGNFKTIKKDSSQGNRPWSNQRRIQRLMDNESQFT